jgi:hypothetical protein
MSDYYRGGAYVPDIAANSGVPTSGTIALSDFYGAQAGPTILDTQTVTIGLYTFKGGAWYGDNPVNGSISDGTFNPKSGATIQGFYWTSAGTLIFQLAGSHTNADWTEVEIDNQGAATNYTFTRASASFTSSTNTVWQWTSVSNPFGYVSPFTAVCEFT